MSSDQPEHQPVDGGFECHICGALRRTSLGINRHYNNWHPEGE